MPGDMLNRRTLTDTSALEEEQPGDLLQLLSQLLPNVIGQMGGGVLGGLGGSLAGVGMNMLKRRVLNKPKPTTETP